MLVVCGLSLAIPAARADNAAAPPVASARNGPWSDYQIIMWQPKTAKQYLGLKEIGITGAAMVANRSHPQTVPADTMEPLVESALPWYVENAATDFYSAYHRWFPDRAVNWRFEDVQKLYEDNPGDRAALIRDPSLSDGVWLERIEKRLGTIVRANRPYRPLYYVLGDETGIADLNAFWDFDVSEPSLAAMRTWLKDQYGSLASLNMEWGTDFADWDHVTPLTTRDAMRRSDGNFAP